LTEIEKQKSFRRIKLFSFRKEWEGLFLGIIICTENYKCLEVLEKNVACPELEEILTEYRKPVVIKDDDLFFGHSIAVNGSPKKGLLSADIEG